MKTEKQIFEDLQNAANIVTQNKRQLITDCCSKVMAELSTHKIDLLVRLLWNTETKDLKRIFELKSVTTDDEQEQYFND